ncbi:SH3 domain-containing protein [Seiridium cupressi]
MACIPLSGSTTCPAFQSASISTNTTLVQIYPFLQYVSDRASFDSQLESYVQTSYVQQKYQQLLGCDDVNLTNTSELYARFTTSVICNGIVQNSVSDCDLTGTAARPLCADSCAQFAESEAYVISDTDLCRNPNSDTATQIRADFTNCALPADSLSSSQCVTGSSNEPDNCGYGNSTLGLCSYCSSGGINSTDTCCYSSNAESLCANVALPQITSTITLSVPTSTATSGASTSAGNGNGLSGGAIAGVVIGSIAGLALLLLLAFLCIRLAAKRKRSSSQKGSIFNQPAPSRNGQPPVAQIPAPAAAAAAPKGYEVLPGGRIARMSALEGHSGDSPPRHGGSGAAATAAGAAAGYMASHRRRDNHSSSDEFGDSPSSDTPRAGILRPPPTMRRHGSLSSGSMLAGDDAQSPTSAGMSSPQGMASQQSEQLPFFKDYYSQDDIHPGDRVAVLWAYQPRAADEFALDRGDMLKVVGIWDDGWATGILTDERADEWEARRQNQRDSGVSNTSGRGRDISPPVSGDIKAFPLVCVCLPEHWRKTIEGDGSTESGSSAHQGHHV